jgi:transcriptional regulator with XRE-family HTH domain
MLMPANSAARPVGGTGMIRDAGTRSLAMTDDVKQNRHPIVEVVASRIRALRKSRGETGTRLAQVLGITQQQEAKLEQGVCNVSLVQLWKIAQHYDVPLESFLDEQGPLRMERVIRGDLSAAVDARHKLRVEVAQATRGVTTPMLEAVLKVLQAAQK